LRIWARLLRARSDRNRKRVSGKDFKVEFARRRAGDPAQIVAAAERARSVLKWEPRLAALPTIIEHALAWERKLQASGEAA